MMTERQAIDWLRSLPKYREWAAVLGHYVASYDYSGPENNKFLKWLIPSKIYGINCNPAFYAHDGDYVIGGDDLARHKADANMLMIGLRIVEEAPRKWWLYGANWLRRNLAKRRLLKYYNAVRAGGKSSFNYTGSADA